MSSKAIKERTESELPLRNWQPPREVAPSVMREDEMRWPRLIAVWGGIVPLALGGIIVVMNLAAWSTRWPGVGNFLAALGLISLLYHAARDADLQVRRSYLCFAGAWLGAGIVATIMGHFLSWGFLCLLIGMFFLLPATRHETDPKWHAWPLLVLGLGGTGMALTGFIGANVASSFLLPYGLLLSVLGLGYLWSFVGLMGIVDDRGYRVAQGMGLLGGLVFLVAVGRSVLPPLFHSFGWINRPGESYFAPTGMLLMLMGLLYVGVALTLCSDHRLVVMTRRELASFFYSPIAYIVLFCFMLVGMIQYYIFVSEAQEASTPMGRPIIEPIIFQFMFSLLPVFVVCIVVPVLTMRLYSEEKRTGTLEVLLTAPVDETSVVLSKFFAALIFFMITWVPWGLSLIALRVGGGQEFDWRPLLSFSVGLLCSGAGFVSMGGFFSSVTRNQIIAVVLTFLGMLVLLSIFFIHRQFFGADNVWKSVLTSASFIDQWMSTLQGKLAFRDVVFPLSSAVFFLFLTVKILEARKWQ